MKHLFAISGADMIAFSLLGLIDALVNPHLTLFVYLVIAVVFAFGLFLVVGDFDTG